MHSLAEGENLVVHFALLFMEFDLVDDLVLFGQVHQYLPCGRQAREVSQVIDAIRTLRLNRSVCAG